MPHSGAGGMHALHIPVFREMIDDIGVRQLGGKLQRIDVGIQIDFARTFHMEVNIQNLDVELREQIVDVAKGFGAVDELDLHALDGVDAHDLLQQYQYDHDHRAADERIPVISETAHQTKARRVPQGSRRGQTGNLSLRGKNRTRTQEADAADDLSAHSAQRHGDIMHIQSVDLRLHDALQRRYDARAQTDQNVRAHACGTILGFTLHADDRTNQYRHEDSDNNFPDVSRFEHPNPSILLKVFYLSYAII